MKKTYFAAVFTIILILTSCARNASVGVIGGADGPSEIIVGGDTAAEHIDVFMLDGALYYDTGEKADAPAPDAGTTARLSDVTASFETPKKNGEATFFYDGDIRLFGDGTARAFGQRFDRLDIPEESRRKYCFTLSGVMPNAAVGTVFLVLSDDLGVTFDDAVYKLLGADLTKMKDIFVFPIGSFEKGE